MTYKKGDKVMYQGQPWKVTAEFGDNEYMISRDDPNSDWAEELIAKDYDLSPIENDPMAAPVDESVKKEAINGTCPDTLERVKAEVTDDMSPQDAWTKIKGILVDKGMPDDDETVNLYYQSAKGIELKGLEESSFVKVHSFKEMTMKEEGKKANSEEEILQEVRRWIQEKGLLNTNISKDGDGSYYITNNPDGGIPNGFLERSLQEFEYLYPDQFEYEGGDFDNHLYFRIHIEK